MIIAIDQSTSATKALLYDESGTLRDKSSREHRQIYPRPGWVEHDAEEIWQNTLAVLQLAKSADPVCLSITNQRETVVVFDRATGRPLHNALVWQDRRGAELCSSLAQHGSMVASKTGLKIDTYFSASKLTWLIDNHPRIAQALNEGAALVGTIDAYLIHRLTKGQVFATDHTNASRTLLFDIARLCWDQELCHLFRVPIRALPQPRNSTGRFGQTDLNGLLPAPIPICGVMGDSQASLFAHRCFEPGMAKVTLGSGSSVLLNIGRQRRDAGTAAVSTIAWTHQDQPTYSFEGIINYAAATVQWLKDQLGLIQSAAETEAAALSVDDNGGVYFIPAFGGLSAPYWSPDARAAIVGMTAHANRNHVIRAALESIAYQLRDVLDAMKSQAGMDQVRTIHADGGATRNQFLMQFIADVTGLEVSAAPIAECSPLGAAMAGMLGIGIYRSFEQMGAIPRQTTSYRPKMQVAQVAGLYDGWRRAVDQVLAGAGGRR